MNAAEYAAYLQSPEWKETRRVCLDRYEQRCQVCGCTHWRRQIDVHHLNYRNVGHEEPADIVPLCTKHHQLIHNQPDGYDRPVLDRLKQECDENNWDDPMPAYLRERWITAYSSKSTFECPQCFSSFSDTGETFSCPYCGSGLGGETINPLFTAPDDDLNGRREPQRPSDYYLTSPLLND